MPQLARKCSCCKWVYEQEVERRGSSDRIIQDLVELPTRTKNRELLVVVCPSCDGIKITNSND